jgi:hypothetical protein
MRVIKPGGRRKLNEIWHMLPSATLQNSEISERIDIVDFIRKFFLRGKTSDILTP